MTLRFIRLFCLLAIFAISSVSTPVSAETFNITPQDDWFEILSGPAFLQPGDELVFGAGTYTDGRRLSVSYRGTAANPVTIRAAEGAEVIFTRDAAQNVINLEGAQYLTVKGLEIFGGGAGIRIGEKDGIQSKFITLDGNHIYNTNGAAITANYVGNTYEGMHFLNNEIHNTGAEGEAFYVGCNNNGCQFFDGIIEKNYIHDLVDPGNGVYQGDGIEVKIGSYNNIIRDNVIVNTNYPGITAYGVEGQGARNLIEGNVLIDIQNHGIQVASDAVIQNNLILSALYDGIHIQSHQAADPGNLDVLNNTVRSNVGNDYNTSFVTGHAIRINNPSDGADWSGPILFANNALFPEGTDNFQTRAIGSYQLNTVGTSNGGVTALNNVSSHTGEDLPVDSSGNLATDFVDILNLDAFPAVGGKLIGAGSASDQPSDDFNLTSRNGSNDVGAYRFDASGNPGWTVGYEFKQFSSSPGTPGDFDADVDVDGADFLLWQRDTSVGSLTDWQDNYGTGVNSVGTVNAVPEPSTGLLLLMGSFAVSFLTGRKR